MMKLPSWLQPETVAGHGHATIDTYGNVIYLRDAWTNHDDYLIDKNADIKPRKYGKNAPTHKI